MGEYITLDRQQIKLGTCEDLYYTRLEQIKNIPQANDYLNPTNGYRYRFPFPEEDDIKLGEYDDYDKGLVIRLHPDDYSLAELEHYDLCHSCSINGGYNVNVMHPCPQSLEFKETKHSSIDWKLISIKQQKQVDGELWVVIACPYCGAKVRLPLEDAIKLVHSIEAMYIVNQSGSNKEYYQEVVNRILEGYNNMEVFIKHLHE